LVDLPEGAEATVWYQTAADERCVFTGDPLSADPFGDGCADGGWHAEKPADSSEVTAIKVQIDFAEPLQPGDGVELRYRTRTLVTLPEGAPEVDAPAWNSMVVFTTTDAGDGDLEYETLEPNKAGITFQLPDFKVAVGDVVWIDSDRDGIQDDGELPLDGVTVALFEKDGTKVGETQTDEHGRYLFDELPVGEYYIEFTLTDEQAARFAFTADGAGDDRAADSNADPATGRTPVFRLDRPSDETPEVIEAGDYADQEVI